MNYNIKVIKPGTTQAKFLDEIEPGSTVLECGSATGYMTRFMSEKLNAKVYIVEYEKKAFDIAINYAEGGLCADLMGNEWREYFRGFKFDYILFADVLEHVYDPSYVLQSATALLKPEGKMLVSVPNIGHNDILMSLYEDNWTYKPIGLLDETHIRFFGRNNLDAFFNKAGLTIIKKDFVAKDYEDTEHKMKFDNVNSKLLEALKLRDYGNIYQFVMIAQRTDYVAENDIRQEVIPAKAAGFVCNFFYGTSATAFSKDSADKRHLDVNGVFDAEIDYIDKDSEYFRYDPIEGTHSVVTELSIKADDVELSLVNMNGKKTVKRNLLVFENNDPQVVVKVPVGTKKLSIHAKVIPVFTELERKLMKETIETDDAYLNISEANITNKQNFDKKTSEYNEIQAKYLELKAMYDSLEKDYINVVEQKNKAIRKLRKAVSKLKTDVRDLKKVENDYNTVVNSASWKVTKPMRKIAGMFESNDVDKEKEAKIKEQTEYIKNSKLFDEKWYLSTYPDLAGIKNLAEHYLLNGWKEGRNPSEAFVTKEYLALNNDVREKSICPLLHYEKNGKFEERHYRIDNSKEVEEFKPSAAEIEEFEKKRQEECDLEKEQYKSMEVVPNKIVFKTFQAKYTCNPKYICDELLKENVDCDIVWLYKPSQKDASEFPEGVRLVPVDSKQAREELATAKVIIDNGSMPFNRRIDKKENQIGICTWHGSLGFKKLGVDTVKNKCGFTTIDLYRQNHDILISNSDFENDVYRNSYWPDATIWKDGHARNDILVNNDTAERMSIKRKVCTKLGIAPSTNLILYAPTFREGMIQHTTSYVPDDVLKKGSYDINYEEVVEAFENKFGGKWAILARHHFVNSGNKVLSNMLPEGVINATKYPDIQELMIAADAGITDYSSWILDFMMTRKPGFIFAVDADDYETDRGMYYPLRTAPFSVSVNSDELAENIKNFDDGKYKERVENFLKDKGCIDDGKACKRIVNRIKDIMS